MPFDACIIFFTSSSVGIYGSFFTFCGKVVRDTYEREKNSDYLVERITNAVSVYVLKQSMGYMDYLRNECG